MERKSLCIIFGGSSSEYEISLLSACSVLQNINKNKYDIHMIAITKCGKWYYYDGGIDKIPGHKHWGKEGYDKAILSPDRGDKSIIRFKPDGTIEKIKIDVILPVLHGKNGEDGTIQGLFELAGIPYVGSGVLGSAVCMDKCVAKILFKEAGIPQANWVQIKRGSEIPTEEIEKKLGYPCFIKPAGAGSSIGISKANNREELVSGVNAAFEHDYKVLVEEAVNAREVESAVIGNLKPSCAETLGEIAPAKEFYDYEAKYEDKNSRLMIPAPLDEETAEKIKKYAISAYKICECRGLARVDFFVEKQTGKIFLNEINTLPGFTSISMYPKLHDASGLPYSELIDKLIDCALMRAEQNI